MMSDNAQGQDPIDIARAYIAEAPGARDAGWKVEEVAGNIDFGTVTVILGRYDESADPPERVETAEGHGTTIPDAVNDALGRAPT